MMRKAKRKQIVVIGLGQFGRQISIELAEHADILAIDDNKDLVDAIAEKVQRALCLDASKPDALESVVNADFDEAIVCVGEKLETSVLCTLHLKQIGIKSIRAKALNSDHSTILKLVGANEVIYPERESASRMARQIMNPNLLDFVPIAEDYQVSQVNAPENFVGRSLIDLELRKEFDVFVAAIKKGDDFKFMPGADYVVEKNDVMVMIGKEENLVRLGNGEE